MCFQTLFNPNKTVVKMFVVLYDFSDMPPKAQTFLRQRTFSMWKRACHSDEVSAHPTYTSRTKPCAVIFLA